MKPVSHFVLGLVIALFSIACSDKKGGDAGLEVFETVKNVQDVYRKAWLEGDSSAVLATLSDDVILFPPGRTATRVVGKKAVSRFWFPVTGDTSYPIKVYEITDQEIFGEQEYVYFTGKSFLVFDTNIKGAVQRTDSSRAEFFSIYRRENGRWRIFRQMWNIR